MDLLGVAKSYLAAGLCVLPATPSRKMPRLGTWRDFHARRPNPDELERWSPFDGICIVCGPTSGNVEMIDFDGQGELYKAWSDAVASVAPELLARLVIERSPSGGYHAAYRCEGGIEGNQKLAQRAFEGLADGTPLAMYGKTYRPQRQPDGTYMVVLTLIETRGTGGLFLCAPTPGYVLIQGTFEQIPTITAAERTHLLQIARSLTEWHPEAPGMSTPTQTTQNTGEKPGDAYNARGDVPALLRKHGWTLVGDDGVNQRWRRPGKDKGISATWHTSKRVFYCFSSSTNLPSDKGLPAFALLAYLEHGGHFSAAAAALRRDGYGEPEDPCIGVDLAEFLGETAAVVEDKPEPALPDPGLLPRELLNVPGLVGDVMRHNLDNAINPIPELALAGALCLMGVLAGRKVRDELDNRTNLYMIGTAGSGAGKNYARIVNRGLLFEAGAGVLEGPEDIASDSGLLSVVEKQPACLFQIDEIGRFLKTLTAKDMPHLAAIMTLLMRLYSSPNTVYKGKAFADNARTREIINPNVVVYGTGVPEEFYESLAYTALVNGSMARLMIFEGTGVDALRRVKPKPFPPELLAQVRDIHLWKANKDELANNSGYCLLVDSTPDASDFMADFRNQCYLLARNADQVGSALWSRCAEKAHKLSLVYACSKSLHGYIVMGDALRVEMDAVSWAARLAEWNTRRMIFLADRWVSSSQFEGLAKRTIRYLSSQGGKASRRQIMRKFHINLRDAEMLLRSMLASGEIAETGDKSAYYLP